MALPDYAQFYRSMADVYRTERERSDACLADIVNLVCASAESGKIPALSLQAITDRLMAHYERRDPLSSHNRLEK